MHRNPPATPTGWTARQRQIRARAGDTTPPRFPTEVDRATEQRADHAQVHQAHLRRRVRPAWPLLAVRPSRAAASPTTQVRPEFVGDTVNPSVTDATLSSVAYTFGDAQANTAIRSARLSFADAHSDDKAVGIGGIIDLLAIALTVGWC